VALLIEAMLSFLGVGAQPDRQVSWGAMLEEARQNLYTQPLLAVVPGAAITFAVLLFNLTGEAIGDMLAGGRKRQGRSAVAVAGPPDRNGEDAEIIEKHSPSSVHSDIRVTDSRSPDFVDRPDLMLELRGLTVTAHTSEGGEVELVSNVDLGIARGEVYGLVGESGCGKSMTALAVMGLLPSGVRVSDGTVSLGGEDLTRLGEAQLREVRGNRVGMVFQEAGPGLSPTHTIGDQLVDAVRSHAKMSEKAARDRAAELLSLVGVPDARKRLDDYPHQFSGGMAQRVVIAGALANDPEMLIADEPTTALDVTIQAQVLDLILDLTDRLDMSVLLITHDMGVVANSCDRVAVMYAGQIVEQRTTTELFRRPQHPYSEALMASMPSEEASVNRLRVIPGTVPAAWAWPSGCRFHPRCEYVVEACKVPPIPLIDGSRCIRVNELVLEGMG
jgi:peptide/nickel transport system permease protein